MNKNVLCSVATAMVLVTAWSSSPSPAETASHIKLDITVQQEITVKDAQGGQRVELVEPKLVVPGDEVIYTITYTNVSAEPTSSIVVTNRIPEQMTYVRDTAIGQRTGVFFSVDGTQFAPRELVKVQVPDGAWRPATEQDLTFIRWVVNATVPPGESGTVSYRARLQ